MLTQHEREALVEEYRGKPVSVVGLLLTCAGALAVVIALLLIGSDMQLFSPAPSGQVAAERVR